MAQWAPTTVEELRQLTERVAQERGWDAFYTPRNLMMSLIAEVGEVTEIFQWREDAPPGLHGWSESDKRRVGAELSDVLLAAIRLADSCGIDLGEAALERISREAHKFPCVSHYSPSPGQHSPPRADYAPPPLQPAPAQQQQQQQQPAVLQRAAAPPAAAALPAPALQPRQTAAPPAAAAAAAPPAAGGNADRAAFRRPGFKRTLSVVTPGQLGRRADPAEVAKQFSPTHFDHGLFSPFTAQKEYEIDYGGGKGSKPPPLPQSVSKQRLQQVEPPRPQEGSSRNSSPAPLSPLSPGTLKDQFYPMVEALATAEFSPREFRDLGLTFCIPFNAVDNLPGAKQYHSGDSFIDLKPQGRNVRVTHQDRLEFVRLALNARQRLSQGLPVDLSEKSAEEDWDYYRVLLSHDGSPQEEYSAETRPSIPELATVLSRMIAEDSGKTATPTARTVSRIQELMLIHDAKAGCWSKLRSEAQLHPGAWVHAGFNTAGVQTIQGTKQRKRGHDADAGVGTVEQRKRQRRDSTPAAAAGLGSRLAAYFLRLAPDKSEEATE